MAGCDIIISLQEKFNYYGDVLIFCGDLMRGK
jgi:hypothetical protein